MPALTASAIGKSILFGEHAVVYGHPAIAIPVISIKAKVTIQPALGETEAIIKLRNPGWQADIPYTEIPNTSPIASALECLHNDLGIAFPPFIMTISSDIPISAGLGSSAAVAVAIIRAMSAFLGFKFDDQRVNHVAFASEVIQHGTPSGIDNSVVTYEKPVYFQKDQMLEPLRPGADIHLVLADSGERALTKDVVKMVRDNREKDPSSINEILDHIGSISKNAKQALISGNTAELGKLMSENHQALRELQVSTPKLDKLVSTAEQAGALGAKLCGGGKGGFMVSICANQDSDNIASKLKEISPQVIQTVVDKGK